MTPWITAQHFVDIYEPILKYTVMNCNMTTKNCIYLIYIFNLYICMHFYEMFLYYSISPVRKISLVRSHTTTTTATAAAAAAAATTTTTTTVN